jgi:hypothetical protein
MLNSDDIQSFSEQFLQELFEKYDDTTQLRKDQSNEFILSFADYWPFFLQNDMLIKELLNLCSTKLVGE